MASGILLAVQLGLSTEPFCDEKNTCEGLNTAHKRKRVQVRSGTVRSDPTISDPA
jgi:hypothetical protein